MIEEKGDRERGGSTLAVLEELSGAGMGRAAMALSELMHERISLTSEVHLFSPSEVLRLLDGQQGLKAGVFVRILKGVEGGILVLLPEESLLALIRLLAGKRVDRSAALTEEDCSVLREVGNILASSYLSALSDCLGLILLPSPPELFLDRATKAMEGLLQGMVVQEMAVVESHFEAGRGEVQGRFFIMADISSVQACGS
ncbi:MAG: chemotaxis protein CheC [candidate division NC10 bacterium]|nr:chemotaxis protein CheC [candidate division NC10 bacterium]